MSTKPQRWIIQFTATRGDQTARVKMGAFGETLAHAIAFVIEHCKGQYDSMTDFAEWPNAGAVAPPPHPSASPETAPGG